METPLPKLPPEALRLFTNFVTEAADKSALHPQDRERFYGFIWQCHLQGGEVGDDAIGEEDVLRLLVAAGFTNDKARDLADVFQHGMGLLGFIANQ